jgi:hypothetical protein
MKLSPICLALQALETILNRGPMEAKGCDHFRVVAMLLEPGAYLTVEGKKYWDTKGNKMLTACVFPMSSFRPVSKIPLPIRIDLDSLFEGAVAGTENSSKNASCR